MKAKDIGLFIALLLVGQVQCIMFYLEPNSQKCLREEVQANVVVTGEYKVSEEHGQKVDFSIRDSNGHILYQKEDVAHEKLYKLSFVTEIADMIHLCFYSHVPSYQRSVRQEVLLITKRGIEAKNDETLGEVAKLKPAEVELKRLEDLSHAIVEDFARMRKNEEEMRDTNEATNSRVLYFSIFSICCLLGLSIWQVFYLRHFFRAKKLIE